MKIKKRVLNDALRVLGKMVCQTSPVELYRSIRFVGDERGIHAMATDGVEAVEVAVEAVTNQEVDFCLPFKELKELVRISRSDELELTGNPIEFPEFEKPLFRFDVITKTKTPTVNNHYTLRTDDELKPFATGKQSVFKFPQRILTGNLSKQQNKKLFPRGKMLAISVSA